MSRLPRDVYLSSYYRRWLGGIENVLVDQGWLGPGELDDRAAGRPEPPGRARRRRGDRPRRKLFHAPCAALPAHRRRKVLPQRFGTVRPTRRRPRFDVGDRIVVRSPRAAGHTRQPGYVSGKPGVVTARLGATLFPDALAVGRREPPQHLYTVAFEGGDLFGADAEPETEVRIDLYETYLVPA